MSQTPQILFEDNHLLVALKAPNVLSQSDATGDPSMLDLLKDYLVTTYNKPGEAYLGLVHRLDRPVGGLMVFAKTSKAAARLAQQLKDRQLHREYVAVCRGSAPDRVTLTDYLFKDTDTNLVKVVPSYTRQGKKAVLYANNIKRTDDSSLMAIKLETGRAHQIRVQLSHAGHPLLGDHRYGASEKGQIALWGMRLSFLHPITDKRLVFVALPPMDGFFAPYQRELEGLVNVWPDIGPA